MNEDDNKSNDLDVEAELKKTMAEAVEAVSGGDEGGPGAGPSEDPKPTEAQPGPQEKIAELEAQVATLRDKWLRAVADLENYKKRTKRDIEDATQRKVSGLLESFLPVGDNLERAIEVGGDDEGPLMSGIRLVRKELYAALARHGIEPIQSVGRPFDPSMHDALQQIDSPDHAPGVIVREFEKGYVRDGRLLRPARVIVAGPGSTGAPPEDDGGGESPSQN